MLLSYQPAFLFVHIEKAAGSSIQLALRPFAPPLRDHHWRRRLGWLGPLNRLGLYRALEFTEHATARTGKPWLPEPGSGGLFKFAFLPKPRDPRHPPHAPLSPAPGPP